MLKEEKVRGTIKSGDGIVVENQPMTLRIEPETDSTYGEWTGEFFIRGNQAFIDAGEYRLELSDGRSGDIIFKTSPRPIAHNLIFAIFSGSGKLE